MWDMAAFGAEPAKPVDMSGAKSVKPTGRPSRSGGKPPLATTWKSRCRRPWVARGMTMVVKLSGPLWIVKGAPGSAAYARVLLGGHRRRA